MRRSTRYPAPLLPLLLPLLLGVLSAGPATAQEYDLLFRDARVLDGTGNPWFRADVAVAGDRIAAVGRLGDAAARRVIDARGLYLAPGFIDVHTHAGENLDDDTLSAAEPVLAQGVTTVVVNPDGGGALDLAAQREAILEHGVGVNVAQLIGHGAVRREVLGTQDRAATPEELEH
nr:amidohydrolase family protein [Gemmatimonadota bacterium]NIY07597.1 amidohydrolase family protein [Gemmatimonadota bacterium]